MTQRLVKAALAGHRRRTRSASCEQLAAHCTHAGRRRANKVERQVRKSAAAMVVSVANRRDVRRDRHRRLAEGHVRARVHAADRRHARPRAAAARRRRSPARAARHTPMWTKASLTSSARSLAGSLIRDRARCAPTRRRAIVGIGPNRRSVRRCRCLGVQVTITPAALGPSMSRATDEDGRFGANVAQGQIHARRRTRGFSRLERLVTVARRRHRSSLTMLIAIMRPTGLGDRA